KDALAMREVHSLEDIDETIEEGTKSKFGNGVEIGERLHSAKEDCCGLSVVVQGRCQISPLHSESVDRRLPAFFCLLSDLNGELNKRRDSDEHRRQLPDRCQHFPVHRRTIISWSSFRRP